MILFEDAFDRYIRDRKIVDWGFRLLYRVKQPNGYFRELGGYYTTYENGYRMMFYGESLEKTPVQEVLILDPDDIVIARDTADLRWPEGKNPYQ